MNGVKEITERCLFECAEDTEANLLPRQIGASGKYDDFVRRDIQVLNLADRTWREQVVQVWIVWIRKDRGPRFPRPRRDRGQIVRESADQQISRLLQPRSDRRREKRITRWNESIVETNRNWSSRCIDRRDARVFNTAVSPIDLSRYIAKHRRGLHGLRNLRQ